MVGSGMSKGRAIHPLAGELQRAWAAMPVVHAARDISAKGHCPGLLPNADTLAQQALIRPSGIHRPLAWNLQSFSA